MKKQKKKFVSLVNVVNKTAIIYTYNKTNLKQIKKYINSLGLSDKELLTLFKIYKVEAYRISDVTIKLSNELGYELTRISRPTEEITNIDIN